jgi:hypothetical protein
MKIQIANDDRANVFAELLKNDETWGEVIYDSARGRYLLTLLLGAEADWREYELREVLEVLHRAVARLGEYGFPLEP